MRSHQRHNRSANGVGIGSFSGLEKFYISVFFVAVVGLRALEIQDRIGHVQIGLARKGRSITDSADMDEMVEQ